MCKHKNTSSGLILEFHFLNSETHRLKNGSSMREKEREEERKKKRERDDLF